MLYGEHLNAREVDPGCQSCAAPAAVEVFDALGRSRGDFCQRCGRRKLKELARQEARSKKAHQR